MVKLDRVAGDGLLTNAWDSATCLRNKQTGSVQSQVLNFEVLYKCLFTKVLNQKEKSNLGTFYCGLGKLADKVYLLNFTGQITPN